MKESWVLLVLSFLAFGVSMAFAVSVTGQSGISLAFYLALYMAIIAVYIKLDESDKRKA